MKKLDLRLFKVALILALIVSVLISSVSFEASCRELKENILRLHIIANSDSEADQALKLKVRDAVLSVGSEKLESVDNIKDAITVADGNVDEYLKAAKQVIKENGYNYNVTAEIKKTYFSTRVYESFTLPAGEYEALQIIIGEGKGKNWWCVMYPAVCLTSAARLDNAVSDSAAVVAEGSERFKIGFKTVEIIESIKKFFKKRK